MKTTLKIAGTIFAMSMTAGAALADSDTSNALEADAQALGHSVVIRSVSIASDGWLVVHAIRDGKPVAPSSIGHTFVKAGTNQDVYVALTADPRGDKVLAMLHHDDGTAGVYEFGAGGVVNDKPVIVDGKPVVMAVSISR